MRDPYDILGVARGASLDEIKTAYRRASKAKHPDLGGSHEEMTELNTAYAYILSELKRAYQQQREEAPRHDQAGRDDAYAEDERRWQKAYRDIDDELEELRRAAQVHEERLRTMRAEAWESGDRVVWAKLTWDDLSRFFRGILHSGLKGLALLFAALLGVGSILVETNFVSGLVILGSGLGFFLSLALKNDKGGFMSAGLLLFGVMSIWLPPVRAALLLYPLATISVLVCLGLILKFAQQGGTVGLMTGGVLALYLIGVIVTDTQRREQRAAPRQSSLEAPRRLAPATPENQSPTAPARPQILAPLATRPAPPVTIQPEPPPFPPEPRTLLASKGAVLKFVAGVTYHLKVRTGFTTSLFVSQGRVAFFLGDTQVGECVDTLQLPMRASASSYEEIDRTIRACGRDAIMRVNDVR
jgi:hypothetical protein